MPRRSIQLLSGLKLLETPVDNYRKLQCVNTNHYLINIRKIKINEIFLKKVCYQTILMIESIKIGYILYFQYLKMKYNIT